MKRVIFRCGAILLMMFVAVPDLSAQSTGPWVMFDPGHGGDDPGSLTPRADYYEKHINLQVDWWPTFQVGFLLSSYD